VTGRGRRPRGGQDRGPRPVGEALDDVVSGLGPSPPGGGAPRGDGDRGGAAALGTVFSRWEELVGEAVARHARPLRLAGGTLVVAVDQPAWATQVRVLAPGILTRVAERTGERLDHLEVVVRPLR
jgi:Dna[CI] antecedent, DciA